MPWAILISALALMVAGCLGIARSEELAASSGRLLRQQVVWSCLSFTALLLATAPSYRPLCRHSYAAFVGVLVLLVAVYFFPAVNGSRRWIRLAGVGFQPSEFAKPIFILMLARYLMYRDNFRRLAGLIFPLGLTLVPVLLILREPDLGTALVFLPLLMLMLWVAGARRKDLALVVITGLATLPLLWTQMNREQRSRITALFEQTAAGEKPTSDGYHLHQAKLMLALGGVWGSHQTGEIVDDRTVYHVPEGATDSIFVVLVERYGLVGAASLLAIYGLLIWRILVIAERTREPFGRLASSGVAALFCVQVIINTGMMVGLLPITGLSLPLVSYGGSGLLAHSLALGLVANIALRPGYEVGAEPFRFIEAKR